VENLRLVITPDQIHKKIAEAAKKIDAAYAGKEITLIMVMKGALCLTADLIRQLKTPLTIDAIQAKSYGLRGIHRGELRIEGLEDLDLASKDVLVVDDIYDSGQTLSQIVKQIRTKNPRSVKSLVLLSKNIAQETDYSPDYALFSIENLFVIGYGLDYKEHYRGLPGIYVFEEEPR
jgi:hypoxanthine phosphoribosyltransferase